jgi:hypothetical protein
MQIASSWEFGCTFQNSLVISRYYHSVKYWQILLKSLEDMTMKNLQMMVMTLLNKKWLWEGRQ